MAMEPAGKPLEPKQDNAQAPEGDKGTEQPYLGTWKTREAAEQGLTHLQELLNRQGEEVGGLRKQTEFFQRTIEQMRAQNQQPQQKPQTSQEPDYGQELQGIEKQMSELDPDEPGYHKELSKLVAASNRVTTKQATQAALMAAQAEFKRTLDERDIQTVHKDFRKENPDFDTPEMQMRIQEYIAKDPYGMTDHLVAYREIQRDDAMAKATQAEQALQEKERLLALKAGAEATGTVVTKGQSLSQKTKQQKLTGTERDQAMMEALQRAKGM